MEDAGLTEPAASCAASPASAPEGPSSAKAKAKTKRVPKPKIDLDDEIRQANSLAEMSRKMLSAARASSRNNRKAKQRLVKKASKLSPADLERIAVLKRCGLYEEQEEDGHAESGDGDKVSAMKRESFGEQPSASGKKKNLKDALETLTVNNPVLQEIGIMGMGKASVGASPHGGAGSELQPGTKRAAVVLGARARLSRKKSSALMEEQVTDPTVEDE